MVNRGSRPSESPTSLIGGFSAPLVFNANIRRFPSRNASTDRPGGPTFKPRICVLLTSGAAVGLGPGSFACFPAHTPTNIGNLPRKPYLTGVEIRILGIEISIRWRIHRTRLPGKGSFSNLVFGKFVRNFLLRRQKKLLKSSPHRTMFSKLDRVICICRWT